MNTIHSGDHCDFGRRLVQTNDLDPVYVLLHNAPMSKEQLHQWLLAYWCFYHVGTASWIAQNSGGFWNRMKTAAGSKEYPRSSERRHFRGRNAANSVAYLEDRGIESLFSDVIQNGRAQHVVNA